jgi:folylpolyglutamate synthase/dihydrofolate synthase
MCLRMAHQWRKHFGQTAGYAGLPQTDRELRDSSAFDDSFIPTQSRPIKDGIHLGLQNMHKLMAYLPPVTIPYIHIAGTNGKGSVSAMLDSCLRQAGLRTGRYNSPHLVSIQDAIVVNGTDTTSETYLKHRNKIEAIVQERNLDNSEFEILTATAFSIFAASQPEIDVLIIECGMGGLRDATNVMDPELQLCAVLTTVDLDHQKFLGDTIEAIAKDKFGIAVPDGILVVGKQDHPEVYGQAQRRATELNVDLYETDRNPQVDEPSSGTAQRIGPRAVQVVVDWVQNTPATSIGVTLPLAGEHQTDNLATALMVMQVLQHHERTMRIQPRLQAISPQSTRKGIKNTVWKGRCSWIRLFYAPPSLGPVSPSLRQVEVLVDGAHNSSAAFQLRQYVDSLHIPITTPITFIIGLSKSPPKTPATVLQPLLAGCRSIDKVIPVAFSTPVDGMPWISNVPMEDVRKAAIEAGIWPENVITLTSEQDPTTGASLLQALQTLDAKEPGIVIVTGSLYLVADAYRMSE